MIKATLTITASILLFIFTLVTACAHLMPEPRECKVVLDEDQNETESRGFVFLGAQAALFMGTDVPLLAGMFAHKDGRKELHLITTSDASALLRDHGFVKKGTECVMPDGMILEISVKTFPNSTILESKPLGDPT